ncbi:hypothetical protein GH714_005070 [Hevea brasiliensis]|uniref:SUZ domain-containing protein n=1 Tax=Hevea brasiliensis TaxID=3981 RepID=A0A6A6N174_HEVBR|nr:hypothetical protein GH714_005070 [Hevea brasiliensis]
MEGSVVEDLGAPESWEVADLDETMSRLMLRDSKQESEKLPLELSADVSIHSGLASGYGSSASGTGSGEKVSNDIINQVDQFLREALQNPRERLSILRMEQDVEKFICDPTQQQLEFHQLPTSYLRLAAHRVAQHYSLQSMVLLDNNLPDGSGSRIIVRKTSECRLPLIRLADIPVNLPSEDSGIVKVAIKQRPQKRLQTVNNSNSNSMKTNSSKSVEERKEEYNRARARIFNSSGFSSSASGKPEGEQRVQDGSQHSVLGILKTEEKPVSGSSDINSGRGSIESSTSSNRSARTRTEKEPVSSHRPQISAEHQPRPLPQHLPGPWAAPSTTPGIGYGPPETMMTPFNPNHVGARSSSAIYLHSSQYPCQRPGMPFIHPHEHVQPFSQECRHKELRWKAGGHLCSDRFLHSQYHLKLLPLVMNDEEAQRLGRSIV